MGLFRPSNGGVVFVYTSFAHLMQFFKNFIIYFVKPDK